MPNHTPELDALAFSERLKEAMRDCGIETGRGAGIWLSKRFKVSKYTGNAWLNGSHKPSPERAQEMADMFGRVQFEWLYFNRGPKRVENRVAEAPAEYVTHATQLTPEELELVRHYRAADEPLRTLVDTVLQGNVRPKGKK